MNSITKILYPKASTVAARIGKIACLRNWFFQRILRHNSSTPWPVHFTSVIACPERVQISLKKEKGFPGLMPGCYIQAINGIIVEDNTYFGPGIKIISANHSLDNLSEHEESEPILISTGCWLGANSVVLPGVKLGPNTIVGAGAVVTKSFMQGGVILGGVPAEIIGKTSKK